MTGDWDICTAAVLNGVKLLLCSKVMKATLSVAMTFCTAAFVILVQTAPPFGGIQVEILNLTY